jgi:hypothetical protein
LIVLVLVLLLADMLCIRFVVESENVGSFGSFHNRTRRRGQLLLSRSKRRVFAAADHDVVAAATVIDTVGQRRGRHSRSGTTRPKTVAAVGVGGKGLEPRWDGTWSSSLKIFVSGFRCQEQEWICVSLRYEISR